MTDAKEVVNGLEMSYNYSNVDEDNTLVPQSIVLNAIALLKKQEPAQVIKREAMNMLFWCCGACGVAITEGDRFCRMCGKAVKWDG